MSMSDDFLDFLEDTPESDSEGPKANWKVMIVDDDISVHEATKFSLKRFTFLGKGIEWISAFSAKEAKLLFETEHDIALMFLDVVMESDSAGLELARWYRDKRINPCTRIILRTGQPGQAPEREIIINYDLHDYKTKTELTSDKLFTTTVSALRAYHDMHRLEETKMGLEGIIHSTATILRVQTMYEYAKAVLRQIESILDIRSSGIICAQSDIPSIWKILAETGTFKNSPEKINEHLNRASATEQLPTEEVATEDGCMVYMLSAPEDRVKYAIYIEPVNMLNDIQLKMLLMFCNNVSVGLSNIRLYNSLIDANRVTVMSLAQVTESRDHSTGEHVFRISGASERLVRKMRDKGVYLDELTDETVALLGLSATLHDIGKIMVRDQVLLKPDRLTDDEFDEIKQHTVNGAKILETISNNATESIRYLEIGQEIALYHHERWDGTGYPMGLKGRDIPIVARITAVVDVFDALTHERCYKPMYSLEEASKIIRDGRGTFFDPLIVDVFLEMLDEGVDFDEELDPYYYREGI